MPKAAEISVRHFALAGLLVLLASSASAQVVSTCDEAHLQTAINAASVSGGTITFSCSGTITVTAPLVIGAATSNVTIDGTGQNVTLSGGGSVQIMQVGPVGSSGFVGPSGPVTTLNNLTFVNGNAALGGGIESAGNLVVNSCTFSGNSAPGFDGSGGFGGAIYLADASLTVNNSTFSANTASSSMGVGGQGGAIETVSGTVTVSNSTFSGNSAVGSLSSGSSGLGGAIDQEGGTLTVNNSTFANNGAGSSGAVGGSSGGGAISNESTGFVTINNSTFSGNSATAGGNALAGDGGAIYNTTQGTLTVSNSTFSGNTALFSGGALFVDSGTATLVFATLSANSASQGGNVYNNGGSLTLQNSILAGGGSGGNCAVNISSEVFINDGGYNLDDGATCGFTPTNNSLSNTNPQLGPLQNNGGPTQTLALLANSPAIDAVPVDGEGTPTGCGDTYTTDQRGITRPQGTACDIGAYEFANITVQVVQPSITFTSIFGGPAPASQNVTVSTSGFTLPVSATAASTNPASVNWLGVTGAPSTTPVVLTLTASPTGLPAGTATGNVTVSQTTILGGPPIAGPALATIPVTYNVIPVLQLSATCPASVAIGSTYSIPFAASGGTPGYTWSLFAGSLPLGLLLNGATGVVGGTVSGQPTAYSFTIRVTDSGSGAFQQVANFSCSISSVFGVPLQISSACPGLPVAQNSFLTQPLAATGGTGFYLWTVSAGTLPSVLAVTGNTLSGTVTASPGIYNFTLQVTSGTQSATAACSLTVTPPAVHLTSTCPGNGTQGVAYGPFSLSATGGAGPSSYVFSISGSLPTGVTLTGNTISGTPQTPGIFRFLLEVTSGSQRDGVGPCAVTITPPQILITGTCPATAQVGSPISIPVTTSGGNAPYTYSFSGSSGLNFSNGAVTGTLTSAGTASFSLSATDSTKATSQTFACNFPVTGGPLQISAACPSGPINQGARFSLPLAGSGGIPPYKWSYSGPPWLSLTSTTAVNTTLSGTPPALGSFPFSVMLADGFGSTAATFNCSLNVTVPLAIISSAACPTAPIPFQSAFSLSFTGSGGAPPYAWTLSGPPWLSLSTATGTNTVLSGNAASVGTVLFSVTLGDSAAGMPSSFSCPLVVAQPPIPPITITGLSPSGNVTTPVPSGLSLASPAPVNLQGTVSLTFTPNVTNTVNPSLLQLPAFNDPCLNLCSVAIPAGQTSIPLPNILMGTVAGTIQIELIALTDSAGSVLPANHPVADLVIPRSVPVITSMTITNKTGSGFDILIAGYSPPRDMSSIGITFTASQGATLGGATQVTVDASSLFTTFYQSTTSIAGGSAFTGLQIPITLSGDITAIGSVTVTLSNSAGQSASVSAQP